MALEGFNLGTAYGNIVIDSSGVQEGIHHAKQSLSQGLQEMGMSVTMLGMSVTALAAPLAAAFGGAAKTAMDFGEALTNIQAVTGETDAEIENLGNRLQEMATNSRYRPQELANAYYDVAGGVVDVTTRMATMESAIHTAQAGNASLAGTTNALITVMNSYAFSADKASYASDVLTRTVGLGVGTMDQFASALPQVAGLANSVEISFGDLGAQMAWLTTKGNSTSEAAVQLTGMIVALLNPNEKAALALHELGFESGEAAIKQLGLVGAYKALAKTQVAADVGMASIVGNIRALRGATSFATGDVDAFFNTFNSGIEGATAAAEAIQLDSVAAQFDQLMASVSNLAIEVGDVLLPTLADIIKDVRPIVKSITDWAKQNPALIKGIALISGALVILGPVLLAVGAALSVVGTLMGVILSPIGLVVAAIAGLYLAFESNFLGIRDILQPAFDSISQFFEGVLNLFRWFPTLVENMGIGGAIGVIFSAIFDPFTDWGDQIKPEFQKLGDGIMTVFLTIRDFLNNVVGPKIKEWIGVLAGIWEDVRPGLERLFEWFVLTALPSIINFLQVTVWPVLDRFVGIFLGLAATIAPAITDFINMFTTGDFSTLPDTIRGIADGLAGIFWDNLAKPIGDALATLTPEQWTGLVVGVGMVAAVLLLAQIPTAITNITTAVAALKLGVAGLMATGFLPLIPILLVVAGLTYGYANNVLGLRDRINEVGDNLRKNFIAPLQEILRLINEIKNGRVTVTGDTASLIPGVSTLFSAWNDAKVKAMNQAPFYQMGYSMPGGFASGGYTGDGSSSDIAGFVHKREYVVPENGALVMRGGGDTYNVALSVPLDVLRNEPRLQQNAETFVDSFKAAMIRKG